MINKQSLWFTTILSIVLILGIYYITLPNSLFDNLTDTVSVYEEIEVELTDSDYLIALRVHRTEELNNMMEELEIILTDDTISSDEKSEAFNELQVLNLLVGKEVDLEDLILSELNIKSFIEINDDTIKVVVNSSEHDSSIANDIMRIIQEQYEDKMYITVKFESM